MRRSISLSLSAFALILVLAPPLAAQTGVRELGVDGKVSHINPSSEVAQSFFQLQLPVRSVRMGFMVGERVSFEPALAFQFQAFDGGNSNQLELMLNLLYHTAALEDGPTYFGGGLGVTRFGSSGESASAFSVAARAGIKPQIGELLLARLGVFAQRRLENDTFDGVTELGAEFGFSVLIR